MLASNSPKTEEAIFILQSAVSGLLPSLTPFLLHSCYIFACPTSGAKDYGDFYQFWWYLRSNRMAIKIHTFPICIEIQGSQRVFPFISWDFEGKDFNSIWISAGARAKNELPIIFSSEKMTWISSSRTRNSRTVQIRKKLKLGWTWSEYKNTSEHCTRLPPCI